MSAVIYVLEESMTFIRFQVEIDHDHPKCAETIKQMVDFWLGAEERLDDANGDYTVAWLKQVGEKLFRFAVRDLSLYGCLEEFKDMEGWAPLDGSFGIKLLDVETYAPEIDIVLTKPPAS